MLTALALPLLVAALSASPADPCDPTSLREATDVACSSEPLCSRARRVRIACSVRDVMEKRYVFYPVKGKMLARDGAPEFDPRAHLNSCAAAERAIEREEQPLRFYDRMRRCTAAFEDGHLMIGPPERLPQVALGIGLRLVNDRVFVANRERRLLSHLKTVAGLPDLDEDLAIGNEVLEFDGLPVREYLAEVARHVPASSEPARLERAVDAATRRDFLFPSRRTATLVLNVAGTRRSVELPWWISPDAERHALTRGYLRATRLPTTELLSWRYTQARAAWDGGVGWIEGHVRADTILSPPDSTSLREHVDEQNRPAVRMGEVVRRRDRAFCYLQILTFHTETLGSSEGRRPFVAVIEPFVKQCAAKDLDLVLDLRQNGGGYISHSDALFAMLAEPSRTYLGGALLLRASALNQLVYRLRSPEVNSGAAPPAGGGLDPRRIADAIETARRTEREYTPAFLERPLKASAGVLGFDGKVVALVSSGCTSACDRLARLLQASGRATLLGGATEGAGGSQQEAQSLPARWTDAEQLITLHVPNAAMGVQRPRPGTGAHRETEATTEEFFEALSLENRPVTPTVQYSTQVEDLVGHNRGWLRKVDETLFGCSERETERGRAAIR